MSIFHPENLEDMRDYVYSRLGAPVVVVEISPDQMDIAIHDSIQFFQKHNYGEGVNLVDTTLVVSAGVSEYYTGDCGIEAAYDLSLSNWGLGGINTLFSPTHMLLYNDWVTNGNYPGGPGTGYNFGGGGVLTSFEVMGEYMAQANQMLGKQHAIKYIPSEKKLVITPTPQSCGIAKVGLYCRAKAEELYNNDLVKDLAVAKARIQWGFNIGKYSVTMPDGTTLNGSEIMNRGYEDEKETKDQIKGESEPFSFLVG